MIIVFVFFGVYKLVQYAEYTEEYSYELQEIKDGTYAIYHSVSSNVPANNYDVVTICYNGQIHMFQGEVIIQQTNDTPYVNIIRKPHMNNADEITVFIPKGTIEFVDNVGLKQAQIHGFIQQVSYIKYTDELIDSVNKYNDNLESIAQRILNLKIDFTDEDIEMRNLYNLIDKLSVINSTKSRKETEQLLKNVITEYGYMLEVFRDTGKLP